MQKAGSWTDHCSHVRWTTLELILSNYKEALSGILHSDQLLKVILPSQNRPNCPEVKQSAWSKFLQNFNTSHPHKQGHTFYMSSFKLLICPSSLFADCCLMQTYRLRVMIKRWQRHLFIRQYSQLRLFTATHESPDYMSSVSMNGIKHCNLNWNCYLLSMLALCEQPSACKTSLLLSNITEIMALHLLWIFTKLKHFKHNVEVLGIVCTTLHSWFPKPNPLVSPKRNAKEFLFSNKFSEHSSSANGETKIVPPPTRVNDAVVKLVRILKQTNKAMFW